MNLSFWAGAEYNNKIYFSASRINGLFVMDLDSGDVTFLKLFQEEKMKKMLHRAAFIHNNEIWFIPQEAENIACVNLESLDISYYKPLFTNTTIDFDGGTHYHMYYSGRVVDDRYLYLVPADIDTISVIDMKTHDINPVYVIKDTEKERYNDVIVVQGKLWMIPRIGTHLKVLDLDTKEVVEKKWGYDDYSYSSVEVANGKLWFAPSRAKNVLSIDLVTEEHNHLDFDTPNNKYSGIIQVDNNIVMFPIEGDNFIILDSMTSKIVVEEYSEYKYIFTKSPNKIMDISSTSKKMITMGGMNYIVEFVGNNNIIVMSLNDKKINILEFREALLNEKDIDDIIKCYDDELDEIIGLENYLNSIVEKEFTIIKGTGEIGKNIWAVINN